MSGFSSALQKLVKTLFFNAIFFKKNIRECRRRRGARGKKLRTETFVRLKNVL